MPVDNPTNSVGPKNAAAKTRVWPLLTVLGLIVILGFGAMLIPSFGHITGIEYNPNTFQLREFSFYRIPGTKLQISRTTKSNPVSLGTPQATFLGNWNYNFAFSYNMSLQSVLKHMKVGLSDDRWDLVQVKQGGRADLYPASVLIEDLSVTNTNGNFWNDWSTRYPERAEVLWPSVQRLAMAGRYLEIPQLLEIGRSAKSPEAIIKTADAIFKGKPEAQISK